MKRHMMIIQANAVRSVCHHQLNIIQFQFVHNTPFVQIVNVDHYLIISWIFTYISIRFLHADRISVFIMWWLRTQKTSLPIMQHWAPALKSCFTIGPDQSRCNDPTWALGSLIGLDFNLVNQSESSREKRR